MATIRFKFSRGEELRFLSHLDQQKTFQRAIRRARIPIVYSNGFNPHPKLSFAQAMPVGMTSDCEYGDIVVNGTISNLEFVDKMNAALPQGLTILESQIYSGKLPSLTSSIVMGQYRVDTICHSVDEDKIAESVSDFLSQNEIIVEKRNKKGKILPFDILPFINRWEILNVGEKITFEMRIRYIDQKTVKPEVILTAFNQWSQDVFFKIDEFLKIHRINLVLKNDLLNK